MNHNWVGRKGKWLCGTCAPGRRLRRGGGFQKQRFSLGSEQVPHTWDLTPGRWVPWAGYRASGNSRITVGSLDPTVKKGTYTFSPQKGQRGQVEVSQNAGQFPRSPWPEPGAHSSPTLPHSSAPPWGRASVAKRRAQLWGSDLEGHMSGQRAAISDAYKGRA